MSRYSDEVTCLNICPDGSPVFIHTIFENRRFLGAIPYRREVSSRPVLVASKTDERFAETVRENRAAWNHKVMGRKPRDERMLSLAQAMGEELI